MSDDQAAWLAHPEHWRDRAAAMRSVADKSADAETQRLALRLAEDCEAMAARAEHVSNQTDAGFEQVLPRIPSVIP